jgi:hypothetical protein
MNGVVGTHRSSNLAALQTESQIVTSMKRPPRLYCRRCGGDHSTLVCSPYDPLDSHNRNRSQERRRSKPSCRCRKGRFVLDRTTGRKVGYERFYFDTTEGYYYFDGRRLSAGDLERVDWSTPKYKVEPQYLRKDGRLHDVTLALQYCKKCELEKKSRNGAVLRYAIPGLGGRRRYVVFFDPLAPSDAVQAFEDLYAHTPRYGRRAHLEFLICCLGTFKRYINPRLSQRSIARHLRIPRGRVLSILQRFRQGRIFSARPQ